MKIAVIGSREFKDKEFIQATLNDYLPLMTDFISGGAKGVDSWAEEWVDEYISLSEDEEIDVCIEKKIFLPDWDKYGKRAGFIRNELIIKEAELVLAFWDGKSKGSKHSIDLAIQKNIPINIYIRN